MVIFDKIRYKNILSAGNHFIEISVKDFRTNLIIGTNGAGKSILLDAISFGLFGKSYRGVNLPKLVNSMNGRDLVVEIEFYNEVNKYLVRRGIKPNIFEIYINGKLVDQDSKNKDYQQYFEQTILKMNYKSFCQTVMLGSAAHVPFMELPARDRRVIVEDLLDIQIFSVMNTLLKQRLQENMVIINHKNHSVAITQTKIDLLKKYQREQATDIGKQLADLNTEKAEIEHTTKRLQGEIKDLTESIEKLQRKIQGKAGIKKKIDQLERLVYKLQLERSKNEKDIAFYEENENCTVCRQSITAEVKKQYVDQRTAKNVELTQAIEELNREITLKNEKLAVIEEVEEEIGLFDNSSVAKRNKWQNEKNRLEYIESQIAKLSTKTKKAFDNSELEVLQCTLERESKEVEIIQEEIVYHETLVGLLKDTGIKSRIILQYLPVINKLINKYLAEMDFFVTFEFDEELNETIKSRGFDQYSYENFSQGERLRIDLAILFTWREIAKLKNSIDTNLILMDEILDRSLDELGIDNFFRILPTIGNNLNVFIISPKGGSYADKFQRCYKFEKKDNFSRLTQE